MPLTVDELKIEVTRASAKTVKLLNHQWIEECAQIVRDNKDSIDAASEQEDEVSTLTDLVFIRCFPLYQSNADSFIY